MADSALEATVAGSFGSPGIRVRRAVSGWPDPPPMAGRRVVITGATSGLGRAAAERMARLGAELTIIGRDPERTRAVAAAIEQGAAEQGAAEQGAAGQRGVGQGAAPAGRVRVRVRIADLTSLSATRTVAQELVADDGPLDVLVHNAGALVPRHVPTAEGFESTWAAQVLSPHVLTTALLDRLAAAGGRVLTMSSGGMYTQRLDPDRMQLPEDGYDGVRAYALAKRAQVVMTQEWARRFPGAVAFHSMHPGWADTPGVQQSLPTFRRVTRPILRTPAEGADTLVWLAAVPQVPGPSGSFWLDRRPRSTVRLPGTSATAAEHAALWDLVCRQSGAEPTPVERP